MDRFVVRFSSLILCLLLLLGFATPSFAADIRSGENIQVKKTEQVENLYSFGREINIDAPVKGDIITAGGNITISGNPTGSINAAGGDITVSGIVGNSIRIAGGNITISGPVQHDIVIVGGTATIEKTASIGGDLIFAGGTLEVKGPVRGNILMSGGNVIISSHVGGNVQGNAGTLSLQNGAEVKGNLNYTSPQRALVSDGAIVHGQDIYHASEKRNSEAAFLQSLIYKLIADILFTLLLLYLFPGIIQRVLALSQKQLLRNGLIGLGFLFLMPIIAIFLLSVLWLGISAWLLYALFLIFASVIAKILVGSYVVTWWNNRSKVVYHLEWKAAVVGPLVMDLLILIPLLGWLAAAVIYLLTLGALARSSLALRQIKTP